MERVRMHPEGPEVSRIVYGTWRLRDSADPEQYTPQAIADRIQHCLELGITTFDLADIYGGGDHQCEATFGAGLALLDPSTRSRIQLITKCDIQLVCDARPSNLVKHYDTSRAYLLQSVEESLRAVGTSYFDVLLLHRPDPLMDADEVAAALVQLREEGKVLYAGVSNFSPSQVDLLQSRLPFPLVTNQIEANVLHLEPLHNGILDHCQQHRRKPMIWSPLAGGRIFQQQDANQQQQDSRILRVRGALKKVAMELGVTVDQVAFAWLLTHPCGMLPIIGTNDWKRIDSCAAASHLRLKRQQWFAILEASAGSPVP